MFRTKNAKLRAYLTSLTSPTPFDRLLGDALSGMLKEALVAAGLSRPQIHIDWTPTVRCITVQARCGAYFVETQIAPDEYTFSYDLDEADEEIYTPLTDAEAYYRDIRTKLAESCRRY